MKFYKKSFLFTLLIILALTLVNCDPQYISQYGLHLDHKRDSFGYIKIDQSDSTVLSILNAVEKISSEFGLKERIEMRNASSKTYPSFSKNYLSLREYILPENEITKKNYEYQFLIVDVGYDAKSKQITIEISDFPAFEQSQLAKQIENSLVKAFEHELEQGIIFKIYNN